MGRIVLATVQHTGTRYISDCLSLAGVRVEPLEANRTADVHRCHTDTLADLSQDRVITITRDPIKILASYVVRGRDHANELPRALMGQRRLIESGAAAIPIEFIHRVAHLVGVPFVDAGRKARRETWSPLQQDIADGNEDSKHWPCGLLSWFRAEILSCPQ